MMGGKVSPIEAKEEIFLLKSAVSRFLFYAKNTRAKEANIKQSQRQRRQTNFDGFC